MTTQQKHLVYATLLRLIDASVKIAAFSGSVGVTIAHAVKEIPREELENLNSQLKEVATSASALGEQAQALKELIKTDAEQ